MTQHLKGHFCAYCGAQLTKTLIPAGYDRQSGERRYKIRMQCPRHRWWRRGHENWLFSNPGGVQVFSERELWHDAVVPEVKQ